MKSFNSPQPEMGPAQNARGINLGQNGIQLGIGVPGGIEVVDLDVDGDVATIDVQKIAKI